MFNKIHNESGILLPDIVASLPLGVIVFAVLAMSVLNFTAAYQDLKEYTKLQDDLFHAIETIRYGYVQRGINTNSQALSGLLSANQTTIGGNGNSITMKIDTNPQFPIESQVSIDGSGAMKIRGNYGATMFSSPLTNSRDIWIFPEGSTRINGVLKYRIINNDSAFTPLKVDNNGNVRLIGINLEAQVRFRERSNGQSADDDLRMNTKSIKYSTKVFMGNTPTELVI
ncbi:MAG: hypothetical protein RAO94_09020 [Candidatus Stygibacter australis]|nr:hypothetical protein [Candidatus Stygibacter australis]MDP8322477.1 hypothetical protein [Candidatus Stygibacter australis]